VTGRDEPVADDQPSDRSDVDTSATAGGTPPVARGESRWLPAFVVVVLIAIPFLLPTHAFPRAAWAFAPIAIGLLVAIVIGDPGRIDRRSDRLRRLSIALTGLLGAVAVVATAWLVHELIEGAPTFQSAPDLLEVGALVWVDVNLTFSLLFWELDSGGSAKRLHETRSRPDLAFQEHLSPNIAAPGWRPAFADYLYLGFTNATAFSPTDVMPLAHWAKLAMACQAVLSITILSLVVANAVNLLG
jgi:hypothetical protein